MGCSTGAFARPGDGKTRLKRKRLHERLDAVWSRADGPFGHLEPKHRRDAAYVWLAWRMVLSARETHIGVFDQEQCADANLHLDDLAIGLFLPSENPAVQAELLDRPSRLARIAARLAEWEALTPEEQEAKRASSKATREERRKANEVKPTAPSETNLADSEEKEQQ